MTNEKIIFKNKNRAIFFLTFFAGCEDSKDNGPKLLKHNLFNY